MRQAIHSAHSEDGWKVTPIRYKASAIISRNPMTSSPIREGSSSAYEGPITLSAEKSEPSRERLLSTRLFHGMCLTVLLIVASAASFSAFYEKWHFREQGARGTDLIAEFDRMIDGTANRPYIYRQLLPDVAN